jgi:hypothetical protein
LFVILTSICSVAGWHDAILSNSPANPGQLTKELLFPPEITGRTLGGEFLSAIEFFPIFVNYMIQFSQLKMERSGFLLNLQSDE